MAWCFLKECLRVEVIGGKDKEFSWLRVSRHLLRKPKSRYLFWWRIASYIYDTSGRRGRKFAKSINRRLIHKYNTEIGLGAKIQPGLCIAHYNGVIISSYCTIGKNFLIRQNTTIGIKTLNKPDCEYNLSFGDNVTIGANTCIIGDNLKIGDNVTFGAMSFVDKDVPSDCTYYTKKINTVVIREA
ncbi:serine acetyltransferase [Leclercia pneumoniae]|uniref:serine acetyltransferase n=1 Tax=Leclercia pneumoniae TaxID=2815358 RepID=UPI0030D22AD9